MGKHVVDFVTVEITKGARSVKAKLYYVGGPFPVHAIDPQSKR